MVTPRALEKLRRCRQRAAIERHRASRDPQVRVARNLHRAGIDRRAAAILVVATEHQRA